MNKFKAHLIAAAVIASIVGVAVLLGPIVIVTVGILGLYAIVYNGVKDMHDL